MGGCLLFLLWVSSISILFLIDSLGIVVVVFVAAQVGFNVLGRYQFHFMPQLAQFPRPVMGRGASLHSHQAGGLPGKPGQYLIALQLFA